MGGLYVVLWGKKKEAEEAEVLEAEAEVEARHE